MNFWENLAVIHWKNGLVSDTLHRFRPCEKWIFEKINVFLQIGYGISEKLAVIHWKIGLVLL